MKIRIQQIKIKEVDEYYINIKDLFQFMEELKKSHAHIRNQSAMLIKELEEIRKEYLK